MKKVLVTGGAGFIGSNFTHYYLEKHPDDMIIVLDRLTYAGNLDNLKSLDNNERFWLMLGDIADVPMVNKLFEREKFDTVVNFAAETHVDRSIENPSAFTMTNIVGTQTLLDACRDHNVTRYHQVSTDEVYGDLGLDNDNQFTETTPIAPNCPYAASKAAADLLVRSYYETFKMPVTISRCSNNYGPYQFPEKLIPYFFRLASEDQKLPVYGDGKNVRDWLYVLDHCRAIDMILEKGKPGEVYNIGGNFEKSNLEITQRILKFLGKDENSIMYVDDRKAHDRRYAIDASKMKKEIGWEPSVSFEEGIAKTFEWYENNKEWWQKLVKKSEDRQHKETSDKPLPTSRP
ncbi:dTDP-glucose 4,6-dehydratase [Patescibacteria group bacterium]